MYKADGSVTQSLVVPSQFKLLSESSLSIPFILYKHTLLPVFPKAHFCYHTKSPKKIPKSPSETSILTEAYP